MKSQEHNSLPEEFLREFQNGTPDSRRKAIRVWELLENVEQEPLNVPSTEDALRDLNALIDEKPDFQTRAGDRAPRRKQRKWAIKQPVFSVALAFLVLLLGVSTYFAMPVEHNAVSGERMAVLLPDGSEVQLNNESSIRYSRGFRILFGLKAPTRKVELDGEAFFVVAENGRPFNVTTFNAEVIVLGTGFNVRAYSEDVESETRVTLEHGKVQVDLTGNADEGHIVLDEKGQQAIVKDNDLEKIEVAEQEKLLGWVTAWRTNGFVALDLSVEALVNQIERYYATKIEVSEELSLSPVDLFYTNSAPTIEQILTELCISGNCSFRKTASGYLLLPAE